jgi:hypothetical protein
MRKMNVTLILAVTALLAYFLWPTQSVLTIMDGNTKGLLFVKPLKHEDRFSIQFTHSIHKTPVTEEYYIDDKQIIVLDQVTYESYGVGNPAVLEEGQTYQRINGKYIVGNIDRRLRYFDFAIGQIIGNPQLIIKSDQIPFSQISPPGSWVRIEARQVSLLTVWRGGTVFGER